MFKGTGNVSFLKICMSNYHCVHRKPHLGSLSQFSPILQKSSCSAGDPCSIPGLRRSPGEGKGYPLQYSGLGIPWTVQSMGSQRVGHDWRTFTSLHLICIQTYTHTFPWYIVTVHTHCDPSASQVTCPQVPWQFLCQSSKTEKWAVAHFLEISTISPK